MNPCRMAPKYNPLDDVPHSVRQNLTQASPCYSIVTDSGSPDGTPHSQVMSPNPPITPLIMTAAAASADQVQLRLQQMLQIQAPADIIRMIHAGHEVNQEAKTVRDVQNNVHRVASELEARTDRLASCVMSLTNDIEGLRIQSETLFRTADEHRGFLSQADSKLTEVITRMQQFEQAVSAISRSQVSFESSMTSRLEILESGIQSLQASSSTTDALQGEVTSMKAALSKLEAMQQGNDERARNRFDEMYKSLTSGQEKTSDLDTRLRLAMERIVGSERVCEKLRKADADIETQIQQLFNHLGDSPQQRQTEAASSGSNRDGEPQTPKGQKTVEEFKLTPQTEMEDVSWPSDGTAGWYDEVEQDEPAAEARQKPLLGISSPPPGLPKHLAKKVVEVPQSAWKLLKDLPKLNTNASEAWERGVAFRQWTTETAAIAEAIHPTFAEYFRRKLDEGRGRYEQRLAQGFDTPPPTVRPEDKEYETRLSLALLKILPARMKAHALEKGNTLDGVSTATLLEALYESYTPGGVREKSSLLQYLS